MTIGKRLGRAALGCAMAGMLGWGGGAAGRRVYAWAATPGLTAEAAQPEQAPVSHAIHATLTPAGLRALTRPHEPHRTVYAVLLHAGDCLTCEDLGRQLRQLRDDEARDAAFVVLADTAGIQTVRAFVEREHIRATVVAAATPESLLVSKDWISTPAVIVRPPQSDSVYGIAHGHWRNVRPVSFAVELANQRKATTRLGTRAGTSEHASSR